MNVPSTEFDYCIQDVIQRTSSVESNVHQHREFQVSVCVCTYRRPSLLHGLLHSLSKQDYSDPFEVIVIDNDPLGTGRDAVQSARQSFPNLHIRYQIESIKGISYARNTAVSLSSGEYIAWIDDDEVASESWLSQLKRCLSSSNADAVFGPVIPTYPPNSPTWARNSGLFDRPRHETGSSISAREARTGNAFVKSAWLRQEEQPFDIRLANTGGEDFAFFAHMQKEGAVFSWCDEAPVFELVPLERQKIQWILERRLRSSSSYWRNQTTSTFIGAYRAALGSLLFILYLVAGTAMAPFRFHTAMKLWARSMSSLGRLIAFSGIRWNGY